jgi:hypothetical protein
MGGPSRWQSALLGVLPNLISVKTRPDYPPQLQLELPTNLGGMRDGALAEHVPAPRGCAALI